MMRVANHAARRARRAGTLGVVALSLFIGGSAACAATFSPPGAFLNIRAGGKAPQQNTVAAYGDFSLSDIDFNPNLHSASASVTLGVTGGRRFDFGASAGSTTNVPAPPGNPNALAFSSFQQNLQTVTPQWFQVVVRNDSAPADNDVDAEISFRRFGQAALFAPGDTGGKQQTYNALLPAGAYQISGSISTEARVAGAHSGALAGNILVMNLADFDGNLVVGAGDLPTLTNNFGAGTSFATGDIDGDGANDGFDVLMFQRQLGTHALAAATVEGVPESGAGLLGAIGALMAGAARSRQRMPG